VHLSCGIEPIRPCCCNAGKDITDKARLPLRNTGNLCQLRTVEHMVEGQVVVQRGAVMQRSFVAAVYGKCLHAHVQRKCSVVYNDVAVSILIVEQA
jgi:hypothetical protein